LIAQEMYYRTNVQDSCSWNIAEKNGAARIIDFGLAEDGHICEGIYKCPDLLQLQIILSAEKS